MVSILVMVAKGDLFAGLMRVPMQAVLSLIKPDIGACMMVWLSAVWA